MQSAFPSGQASGLSAPLPAASALPRVSSGGSAVPDAVTGASASSPAPGTSSPAGVTFLPRGEDGLSAPSGRSAPGGSASDGRDASDGWFPLPGSAPDKGVSPAVPAPGAALPPSVSGPDEPFSMPESGADAASGEWEPLAPPDLALLRPDGSGAASGSRAASADASGMSGARRGGLAGRVAAVLLAAALLLSFLRPEGEPVLRFLADAASLSARLSFPVGERPWERFAGASGGGASVSAGSGSEGTFSGAEDPSVDGLTPGSGLTGAGGAFGAPSGFPAASGTGDAAGVSASSGTDVSAGAAALALPGAVRAPSDPSTLRALARLTGLPLSGGASAGGTAFPSALGVSSAGGGRLSGADTVYAGASGCTALSGDGAATGTGGSAGTAYASAADGTSGTAGEAGASVSGSTSGSGDVSASAVSGGLAQSAEPVRPAGAGEVREVNLQGGAGVIDLAPGSIRNATRWTEEEVRAILAQPSPVSLACDGTIEVLILSTHATEAYEPGDYGWFDPDYASRSSGTDENVTAVAAALAERLRAHGVGVIHDTTLFDSPSYEGAYDRSRAAAEEWLRICPTIQVILDVHRDALGSDGVRLKPTALADGEKAAQVMLIAGCDNGEFDMPGWRDNLRFAAALGSSLEELAPGLTRPILFDYRKYNQDLLPGALLVEVGSHGNTLEEAKRSAVLLADAIAAVF